MMLQATGQFISSRDKLMVTKVMNKSNIVVFDETIIDDNGSLPVVLGEMKDSGGGSVNVVQTREFLLGCYIPFSMADGSNPFRVFIFRSGPNARGNAFVPSFSPKKEIGLREHSHRLFLQNKKGYITIELIKYIMDKFIEWWTSTQPGLHCFLICDNLTVHKDYHLVSSARRHCIHFINIMPGSSHWFQLHDQQPFGLLKKNMAHEKFDVSVPLSLESEGRRTISMDMFYNVEVQTFKPSIVRYAFESVGLVPWNTTRIWKICQHNSPLVSKHLSDRTGKNVVVAYKEAE